MSTHVTIELDEFHAAELEALARRLQVSPGQVVALALDQLTDEPQDYTPEQIAEIEKGLAEIERGEVVSHDEVIQKAALIVGRR